MNKPIVWSIAGTDPSGGAGIQADLKTINALGAYGCTVITAIIAQNTQRVAMIEFPSDKMLAEQLKALREDVPPAAVKIGMLGTAATVRSVADALRELGAFTVYDPVMASSTGATLLEPAARAMVANDLLPLVGLLTPNLSEAAALAGRPVATTTDVAQAAHDILGLGVRSVLVKGGHQEGGFCQDYWTDGTRGAWLTSPRQATSNTHGSGCTLASAIAACVALGYDVLDALVIAKAYVNQGIRLGGGIGKGRGPLAHEGWPGNPADLPWITDEAGAACGAAGFPGCGPEPLGFYPIVDSTAGLERLLPLGVKTAQLRIKSLAGPALEEEIRRGVAAARAAGCRLFINDHWAAALRHGAYGVHLGQADMAGADLKALAAAGLRLGASACTYGELARAWAVRPSCVGIGSVFPTTSKALDHVPIGLERFAALRRLCPVPAVAIGGMTLEAASAVLDAGADGIAVISDIARATDVPARVCAWLGLFEARGAGARP